MTERTDAPPLPAQVGSVGPEMGLDVLSSLFASSADGIAIIGADQIIRAANEVFALQMRRPLFEIVGRPADQVVVVWSEQVGNLFRQVRDTGQPIQAEAYPFVYRDEPERGTTWWDSTVSPVLASDGAFRGWLLVHQDVTERERAEAERERLLAEVQRRAAELGAVFQALPDLFFRLAADGTILDYRAGTVTDLYVPPEQFLNRRMQDVLPAAVAEQFAQAVRLTLSRRSLVTFEYPLRVRERDQVFEARLVPVGTDQAIALIRNITTRRQAEAEREQLLDEAERRAAELEGVVSSVADGLIIYDPQGHILRMNAEAERMLLYTPAERERPIRERAARFETVDGKPFPVDDFPPLRALRGETVRGVPMVIRQPQGAPIWVRASAAPLRAADGRLLGAVVTASDVTALHELQKRTAEALEAERRAREVAEAALRARDEFLAVATHELRTPITSLRGYAELTMKRMERGRIGDPQEIHRAFEAIDRQADRLAMLVNQLLDMSLLDRDELRLNRQKVDLVDVVRRVVGDMQAGTTRHTLTLRAPPSLPAYVDPPRLEQVLYNLVDNAIRYSPQGGPVEIDVSASGPDMVRIAVRDHGVGIPPQQRAQLFTRFFKAGARRPAGGLGLGLYVNQGIVALHGGTISAEFPEDGGSRFIVSLPRSLGEEPHGEDRQ